jgi:hypothetical protein
VLGPQEENRLDWEVRSRGHSYWANCAWDMLGIPAALHSDADVEAEYAKTVRRRSCRSRTTGFGAKWAASSTSRYRSVDGTKSSSSPERTSCSSGRRRRSRVVPEERRAPRRGAADDVGSVEGAVRGPALAQLQGQDGRGGGHDPRARWRVLEAVVSRPPCCQEQLVPVWHAIATVVVA